jgi:hypothetical protein
MEPQGAAQPGANGSGMTTESNQLETLAGGTEVTVTYLGGATEQVFVFKTSMRRMPELGAALATEAKEIIHYVGRGNAEFNEAWLDKLTDQSYETLLMEGRRLNFSRFADYWRRQQKMLSDLNLNGDVVAAAVALQKTTT